MPLNRQESPNQAMHSDGGEPLFKTNQVQWPPPVILVVGQNEEHRHMPEIVVQPIHFEDRSGHEFERLAFAYLLRTEEWESIGWYGQLGSDRGRDIWGVLSNRDWHSSVCYQCANHQKLIFDKAKKDIDKICAGPNQIPSKFVLIVGGRVPADMRDRIVQYAQSKGTSLAEVWSGSEFEERLRRDTPSLIRRFCEGVVFPESLTDLGTQSRGQILNFESFCVSSLYVPTTSYGIFRSKFSTIIVGGVQNHLDFNECNRLEPIENV